MQSISKPDTKPQNPNFSSGPCTKHPKWNLSDLENAALGRSHRAKIGKDKLNQAIELSREILDIPDDYRIGIVPASDTGAVEMALWSLLGERGVDVLAWESFGGDWLSDIKNQLKIEDLREFKADYGKLPDLESVDTDRDVIFTWNGTTSGVKVINGDWIKQDRKGLTICDATSAAFAMDLPWDKLDVTTWSWQKCLGGEAAHGMIVLSPRAVARLQSYTPPWPIPKIFRLTKKGELIEGIFKGATINTPSMLCVEDVLNALNWSKSVGGLNGLIERSNANLNAIKSWVESSTWVGFLSEQPETNSNTSICLKITDANFNSLSAEDQAAQAKKLVSLLAEENVAFDIAHYRDAPIGIRIWGGPTVETSDIEKLLPWLDWAFAQISN